MPPVGFEPTISAGEWPQTYALNRLATGTDIDNFWEEYYYMQLYKVVQIWTGLICV